jgi:hypothetical protein
MKSANRSVLIVIDGRREWRPSTRTEVIRNLRDLKKLVRASVQNRRAKNG